MLLQCCYNGVTMLSHNASFMMEYDIHTVLDGMTLIATSGVLYALWFTPIKSTYQADLDNVKFYYVVRARGC